MYDLLLNAATEFELLARGQAEVQESTLGAYQDVLTGRNPRGPNLAGVDLNSGSIIADSPIVQDVLRVMGNKTGEANSSMQIRPDLSIVIVTSGNHPAAKKVQAMLQKKWTPPMSQALKKALAAKVIGAPTEAMNWSPWLSLALD